MKKIRIFWSIALLALIYISSFGNYLNSGNEYFYRNRVWLALINLLIVSFVMMIIPFVWRLINKKDFDYKKGKTICKWNSIICFIISMILMSIVDLGFIGGVGAIIYYFINMWLFVNGKETIINDKELKNQEKYICDNCGNLVSEADKSCPNCYLDFDDNNKKISEIESKKTGYKCGECGSYVDENATICPNCKATFEDEEEEIIDNSDKKYNALIKLKKLYDKKIITKEEFKKEKEKILNDR